MFGVMVLRKINNNKIEETIAVLFESINKLGLGKNHNGMMKKITQYRITQ